MKPYQQQFIDFALAEKALRFGEYTLKSGRISPYFFNIGDFHSGRALAELGRYYAEAIMNSGIAFDLLFGPAYKGIPLASTAAISLARDFNVDVPYSFNRKVAKGYGEGGVFIGAPIKGRVLIIDDVITAGTTLREMVTLFADQPAEIVGVITALNRAEVGMGTKTATQELSEEFGFHFSSIISIDDIVEFLQQQPNRVSELERLKDYRAEYGQRER